MEHFLTLTSTLQTSLPLSLELNDKDSLSPTKSNLAQHIKSVYVAHTNGNLREDPGQFVYLNIPFKKPPSSTDDVKGFSLHNDNGIS